MECGHVSLRRELRFLSYAEELEELHCSYDG